MSFSRAESALTFRASTLDGDLTRKRLRERYMAVQFPDYVAVRNDPPAVVRLARELHDDGERRLSVEILILAAQEKPLEKAYPLALLELAYLADDAALFGAVAGYFREAFPRAPENNAIAVLGRHIAPRNAQFFGNTTGSHASPYTIPGWSLHGGRETDAAAQSRFRRAVLDGVTGPVPAR